MKKQTKYGFLRKPKEKSFNTAYNVEDIPKCSYRVECMDT